MSERLTSQVRDGYTAIVEDQAPVTLDEIMHRAGPVGLLPTDQLLSKAHSWKRPVLVASAAAAVVILLIGVPLLVSRTPDGPAAPANQESPQPVEGTSEDGAMTNTSVTGEDEGKKAPGTTVPAFDLSEATFTWSLHEGSGLDLYLSQWFVFDGDQYVSIDIDDRIQWSPDGVVWSQRSIPDVVGHGLTWVGDMAIGGHSEQSGDGRHVSQATGDGGRTWIELEHDQQTGFDGAVWYIDEAASTTGSFTSPPFDGEAPGGEIFQFEDTFVGVNTVRPQNISNVAIEPTIMSTADGVEWVLHQDAEAPVGVAKGSMFDAFSWQNHVAMATLWDDHDGQYRIWRTDNGIDWADATPNNPPESGGIWAAGDIWIQGLELFGEDSSSTRSGALPLGEAKLDRSSRFLISSDGEDWVWVDVPSEYLDNRGTIKVANNRIFIINRGRTLIGSFTPPAGQNRP
jgi:hypothetical protein